MSIELQKLFGHNVRRLREEQGLTQSELALKARINRSYLGGVERGQRRICIENIAKIAQALAVSPDLLFRAEITTGDKNTS
ncbi:MAG: helix-turn-helix transcriptional regulator [Anaerolineae bacterium]